MISVVILNNFICIPLEITAQFQLYAFRSNFFQFHLYSFRDDCSVIRIVKLCALPELVYDNNV